MNGSLGTPQNRRRSPSPRPRPAPIAPSAQASSYSRYPPTSASSRPGWAAPLSPTYAPRNYDTSSLEYHSLPSPGPDASRYAYSTTLIRTPQEDSFGRLVHSAEAIRDAGPGRLLDQVTGSVKRLFGGESRSERAENGHAYSVPKERADTAAARFSSATPEVHPFFML